MSEIVDENGRALAGETAKALDEKGKGTTTEEGHLATIEVNGKDVKVVNSVVMLEIVVHKLEDGSEVQQVVAHDFMMVDHKPYMVKLLTDAINTVMKARNKKSSLIKAVSTVVAQRLGLMSRKELRGKKW